jgi:hypothetical protein
MIRVITKSGSVYEFYTDTHNWKRYPADNAGELYADTGIFDELPYIAVGQGMLIKATMAGREGEVYTIHSTPVVSIDAG